MLKRREKKIMIYDTCLLDNNGHTHRQKMKHNEMSTKAIKDSNWLRFPHLDNIQSVLRI